MKNLITIILTITWLFADPPDISVSPQQINVSLPEGQSGTTRSLYISNSGTDDLEWNLAIEESTRETGWTFTNCGQTGRLGPSQSQCDSEYGAGEVNVNGGIQEWTVPYTDTFMIKVWGSEGGAATYSGGDGAKMKGIFELTSGQTIQILVVIHGYVRDKVQLLDQIYINFILLTHNLQIGIMALHLLLMIAYVIYV